MAKNSRSILAVATIMITMMIIGKAQAAMQCSAVRSQLMPCGPYLTGNAAAPEAGCCSGVLNINSNTVTTADRRATCQCLKDMASSINNLRDAAAQQLPAQCGLTLGVPISRTIDCTTL